MKIFRLPNDFKLDKATNPITSYYYTREHSDTDETDQLPNITENRKHTHMLIIDNPAVLPNLPTSSICNVSHSDHRTCEVPEKQVLAPTISLH